MTLSSRSLPICLAALLSCATGAFADVAADLAQAKPGSVIMLPDGVYRDVTWRLPTTGTAQQPVTLRAQTPGKAILAGKSKLALTGEYLVVRDLVFEGCKVTDKSIVLLDGARNCRITDCRFIGAIGKKNDQVVRVAAKSSDNRIDHCEFTSNAARAVQIHVDAETWQTVGYPVATRIDHNLFQDVPSEKHGDGAANGRETIQVGQGGAAESEPRTLVEYNIFLRCNGENECISNKTSANTYRYNSFKDQGGCLSLRGAANCVVEGNRLENMPGIHVQGQGHKVTDNVIIRCGGARKPGAQSVAGSIALGYGMQRQEGSQYPQHYKAAENCLIANNTIVDAPMYGLVIGGGKNQNWRARGVRNVAPSRNRIVNNLITGQSGDLMICDDAPDNVFDGNLIFAAGQATASFYGQNPIKTAPKFRDAAAGDYRLAPGSPNAGAKAAPVVYGPEATTPERTAQP